MPKLDLDAIQPTRGGDYPAPYSEPLAGREVRAISAAAGLVDFKANHVTLPPGCWSSQRHWHAGEDEIVLVLSGAAVLIDDLGRHSLAAGDIAVFRKGERNGHHLVNEGNVACVMLAISPPEASLVTYPDIDLLSDPIAGVTHADGRPYATPD